MASKRPLREEDQAYGRPEGKRQNLQENSDEEFEESQEESGFSSQDYDHLSTQTEREGCKFNEVLQEAEVGVVEKIELVNFMCHRRLDISFSPNVNFILGRNGSGKSAIMTGIMVALGGKAVSTNRGSSLKQFIRTGCNSAEVLVTLRNRGSEAYKPESFGDRIIVERQIKRDGSGVYKLKGARGNVVSQKKEELVTVLDHCNIQIDNPISLLSQDTSRNFLHSSNPNAKYRLFMKATHLEQIAHDYERAEEHQKLMEDGIQKKKELVPQYEKQAKELEEQVQTFERLREMEEKVRELEKELEWAMVIQIEKAVPPIEADIEKERERIPRNESRVKEAEAAVARASEVQREVGEELEHVVSEAAEVDSRRNSLFGEKRTKEKAIRDTHAAMQTIQRQIAGKVRERQALEQKKEELQALSQRDTAGEREERLRQLEGHREHLGHLDNELQTAANDKKQFENAFNHCGDDLRQNHAKLSDLDSRTRSSREQLQRLESSRADQLQAYGPWMRSLVDAIHRNQGRFRRPPKGPIGAMIRLKDYKWSRAVEQVVSRNLLSAFITDNATDDALLKQIMRDVLRNNPFKPDTICSRFEGRMYDVSAHRAHSSYPTVLDMLDVQDVDILNTLIDQCKIESVLLIENGQEAFHVIDREKPPNATSAYTLEGDQALPARYYSNRFPTLGIIKASVDDAIKEEQAKLQQLKSEYEELRGRQRKLEGEQASNKRLVSELRTRMMRKQDEKNKIQMAITELQNMEEEEESQVDVATYDGEIQELNDRIKELEQEKSSKEAAASQRKEELRECNHRIHEFEAEVEKVTGKMEELKAKGRQVDDGKSNAERKMKAYQERLKTITDSIADLEKKASDTRRRAEEAARAASEVCPRIDTRRKEKSIKMEVDKLKRRLEREEPRRVEQEHIQQQYVEAMAMFQKTIEKIKMERKALVELKSSLAGRMRKYKNLQESIANRACLYFRHFLMQRDYDGKIKFNHEKEKLDVQVKVDTHSEATQTTRNTKALSGGERSYTTVCFIMSLWEAMEAPFRCLDEFDVFMDMLNRRLSMRLMLEHAEDQPNRQFIFFTPQDMSSMGVQPSRRIKVFKLSEPERGQTTLD